MAGAAPIQRALLAGDAQTGVAIMQMAEGLDTGDVLREAAVPIDATTTTSGLHDTLSTLGAILIVATLEDLAAGALRPRPQDAAGVTYAAKLDKAEGRVDWNADAALVDRRIRAYAPWPGAFAQYEGEPVKLMRSRLFNDDASRRRAGHVARPRRRVAAHRLRARRHRHRRAAARRPQACLRARFRERRAARRVRRRRAALHVNRLAPGSRALASAAGALAVLLERGCTAEEAMAARLGAGADSTAARAILLGTLRAFPRIVTAVDPRLHSSGRPPQPWLRALLVCAVHQLEHSRGAPHSIVNIAVDAARALGEPRAAGLVNAVLRRFLRERDAWLQSLERDAPAAAAHPRWLYDAIVAAWPDDFASVLAAGNEAPPMTLRVDLRARRATTRSHSSRAPASPRSRGSSTAPWCSRRPCRWRSCPDSPKAASACRTRARSSPRACSRRARASACSTRAPRRVARRVICSSSVPVASISSRSTSMPIASRAWSAICRGSVARRSCDARICARTTGGTVARSIACSSMRRVPAPASSGAIPTSSCCAGPRTSLAFARTQLELLRAAVRVLKPGGTLLYSTCSILPGENADVVVALLAEEPRLAIAPLADVPLPPHTRAAAGGLQILPSPVAEGLPGVTDGFHYVCLRLRDE